MKATPQFQQWFAQSKAVSESGAPLVLYHGTSSDISTFRTTRSGEFGPAIYTTDNAAEASEYATGSGSRAMGQAPVNVMPVHVSLQKPYTEGVDRFWQAFARDTDDDKEAVQRAIAAGFDGVIAKRTDAVLGPVTHYVAFSPSQTKSATGNNGDFDVANPDIRFSLPDVDGDDTPSVTEAPCQ